MPERKTFVWAAGLAGLAGALWSLSAKARRSRNSRPPRPRSVGAGPIATPPPAKMLPAPLAKAPPFGTAVVLALLLGAGGAGGWLYQQRIARIGTAASLAGGNPRHAPRLLMHYGCASCHQISGVPASGGLVGPPLDGVGARVFIGGTLQNSPENLVQWIVDPRSINPHTAMPVTGITVDEARDVAAYLYAR